MQAIAKLPVRTCHCKSQEIRMIQFFTVQRSSASGSCVSPNPGCQTNERASMGQIARPGFCHSSY